MKLKNAAMTTAGNINTYTGFTINQTTASVNLTLPSPTNDASNMHTIYVSNIGSVSVTVGGTLITAGSFATFSWNGSSWASIAGGSTGGSYISSQTSVQSANFFVQAATSNTVAGTLQANSSGTGDILDLLNGAGTPVATFSSAGAVLLKPSTNSTTAFQIQPSGSTTPVLDVDTSNGRVGINMNNPAYALDVNGSINTNTAVYVGGVSVCTASCTPSGGSGNYIQNSTAVQTSANFFIRSASSSAVSGVIQGASSQSVDMLELQTWNGSSATTVDKFASDEAGNQA